MNFSSGQRSGRIILFFGIIFIVASMLGCSGDDPERLFQQGIDSVEAGNVDEAMIWFKKALQADPELVMAHYKLGQVYRKQGDARQSYAHLSRALQQDPQLKEARKELAFLLVENRALDQAIEVAREYLEQNGDDEEIYLILGNSLAYTKKIDEAVLVMEDAISKYPESSAVKLNMAKMLVANGHGKRGRVMAEELAGDYPGDINIQMAMAQIYEKLGRPDLAVFTLENIKKKFSDSPLPYLALAQLSLNKKQPDQAKTILKEAENAGIHDSAVYRLYGMINHRQGDSETALLNFKKAVEAATPETVQVNEMILVDYYSFLKKYKEAQELLEKIIAADGSKKNLKSKVVELFLAQGDFEQAKTSVEELLQENSGDARGHYLKGLMMMKDKDVTEARKSFSKAKELAPQEAQNQFLYGLTFADESEQISITEISEALKKNPNMYKARMALAEIYAKKGELQKSLDELDKIVSEKDVSVKAKVLRIALLLKMNRPQEAVEDAEKLVEKYPDNDAHTFRLAEVYLNVKEYDKALAIYQELQEKEPDNVRILGRIVGIYLVKGESERGMEVVDGFIGRHPDNDGALLVKAQIYLSQGNKESAESVLLPVAEKGKNIQAIMVLAEIHKSRGEVDMAVGYYLKAMDAEPENLGIMVQLSDLYLKQGNNDEAIKVYEKLLSIKKDYLPAMNNLAYLYTEGGSNLDRALELATEVSARVPNSSDVADTLGWIYVKKEVYAQAEPYMQKALTGKPDNPTVLYHMGMLRFGQNRQEEAEDYLRKAKGMGLTGGDLLQAEHALAAVVKSQGKLVAARTLKDQGKSEQAIPLFEEILAQEGFNAGAAADLAVLYAEQGADINKAVELAQNAYDDQPREARVADALGWVYYHQGSMLLARQYINEALENDENYKLARTHLEAVMAREKE